MVAFGRPFLLPGFEDRNPKGTYVLDVEEEAIEGLTFLARRRTGAILYLPAGSDAGNCLFAVPLTSAELDDTIRIAGPANA